MKNALDFEILKSEGGFAVWTPDDTGACIGVGETREEAVKDAIACMGLTIAGLVRLIPSSGPRKKG